MPTFRVSHFAFPLEPPKKIGQREAFKRPIIGVRQGAFRTIFANHRRGIRQHILPTVDEVNRFVRGNRPNLFHFGVLIVVIERTVIIALCATCLKVKE